MAISERDIDTLQFCQRHGRKQVDIHSFQGQHLYNKKHTCAMIGDHPGDTLEWDTKDTDRSDTVL